MRCAINKYLFSYLPVPAASFIYTFATVTFPGFVHLFKSAVFVCILEVATENRREKKLIDKILQTAVRRKHRRFLLLEFGDAILASPQKLGNKTRLYWAINHKEEENGEREEKEGEKRGMEKGRNEGQCGLN